MHSSLYGFNSIKKKILTLALCILLVPNFIAQSLTQDNPESAGFNSKRLALLDDFINNYVEQKAVPGGTFLIIRHGKIVYFRSFGYNSTANADSYDNNDIYRLASMTKAVTSVAIMQLYEQGKLGLDDPVHFYIPAFKDMRVLANFNETDSTYWTSPAKKAITIRHLLTHTSGIVYGDNNPGKLKVVYSKYEMNGVGIYHDSWTTEEFINRLAEVPLAFQPGEKWAYGLNIDVLGRIVEVISGMELDEYFAMHIFKPLEMNDTYFHLPEDKHKRLVPVYTYTENNDFTMADSSGLSGNADYPKIADNQHYAGGGGLSGTAMDYGKFIFALVNNGEYNGYQLLGRKTIETMTADQIIVLNNKGTGFSQIPGVSHCLGFKLTTEEGEGLNSKSAGTYEWGGYFNTKFFIDPKEDLVFVGMTQIVPFQRPDFWDRMYAIIYGALDD